jgi:hypothetical protein
LWLACSVNAQEAEKKSDFGIRFSGFVKTDFWYDSRQVVGSRDELFLFYPKSPLPDISGKDINARGNFNFTAMTSRLTGHIKGPDAFKAKTSGMLEGDFSGVTNNDINGLRLRHAWVKLQWENTGLLIGQWWHPMFVTEVVPTVVSLNTGSPFQPFIRNPQATITHKHGKLNTLFSVIGQRDNSSDGPKGFSPDYMRNAIMPNLHLQFNYSCEKRIAGLAADYKVLRPRLLTDSLIKTAETISTWAAMGYFKYKSGLWEAKAKAIYGQNLTEHLLMGGYAESRIDSSTGHVSYTPMNNLMAWGNIVYGKKVQVGLFAGYSKNYGANEDIQGKIYGRGANIDYLWRIAPSITFVSGKTQFSTELEYTAAAYGTPDIRGMVKNPEEVSNLRLLFTAFYFF